MTNQDLKIFAEKNFPEVDPKIFGNIAIYSKRLNIAIAGTMKDLAYDKLDVYSLKNVKELKPLEIRGK